LQQSSDRTIDLEGRTQGSPLSPDKWDAKLYEARHSFVWQHGAGIIDLLAPKARERILDLGCGTGQLTVQIAASGAQVIGIDNSPGMLEEARENFPQLDFELADAADFQFEEPFDAVFSNAALHWIQPADRVVRSVARALKPDGRFVAEFGGKGNVANILSATRAALQALGADLTQDPNPWYFPSIAEYAALLESQDLSVTYAALFDRPTRLEGDQGIRDWIRMFGHSFLRLVRPEQHQQLIECIEARLRPELYRDGTWFADYRRLRVVALRDSDQAG
jgi:trans-aconitate methyltransferase